MREMKKATKYMLILLTCYLIVAATALLYAHNTAVEKARKTAEKPSIETGICLPPHILSELVEMKIQKEGPPSTGGRK